MDEILWLKQIETKRKKIILYIFFSENEENLLSPEK